MINSNESQNYRIIDFVKNFSESGSPYASNSISSKEYTMLTLIPKTLVIEFQNLSYFWFIIVIFFDFVGQVNYTSARLYIAAALGFLLSITLVKNLIITLYSYRADETINNRTVRVWKRLDFSDEKSMNLKVGNIILVRNGEYVPADILLLAHEGCRKKCLFSMKKVLGSKELVSKKSLKDTQLSRDLDTFDIFNMTKRIENVKVTNPNKSFKNFKAKIKLKGNPKAQNAGLENFIIGGSKLIGNEWIIGLVVYTGMETKVWINAKTDTFIKLSKMEVLINKLHLINFAIISIITLICSLLTYYQSRFLPADNFGNILVNYLVLYCNLIPISLFLCIRASKYLEIFAIRLFSQNIVIKNPRIIEDLGRVEYVLSGKSGILKDEKQIFTGCVIGDQIFAKKPKKVVSDSFNIKNISVYLFKNASDRFTFIEQPLRFRDLKKIIQDSMFNNEIWLFVLCLCIFNQPFPGDIKKYTSADEKIFAKKLEKIGVKVKKRTESICVIGSNGIEYSYEILAEFVERNSVINAKIILRCITTGKMYLLEKGPIDTISNDISSPDDVEFIKDLRTLEILKDTRIVLFAYKEFSAEESDKFCLDYKAAKVSPINAEDHINDLFYVYKKNLKYLGVVGLKYKVKKDTKLTIETLNEAGIKTWIVSGDTQENSLIACTSSGVFQSSGPFISLADFKNPGECLAAMKIEVYKIIQKQTHSFFEASPNALGHRMSVYKDYDVSGSSSPQAEKYVSRHRLNRANSFTKPETKGVKSLFGMELIETDFYLLVDSTAFDYAVSSPAHRKMFAILLFAAKSVCFYSMLPCQKRGIIKFLRTNFSFKPTVLAVGDGKKDFGMLDESDIGVSIKSSVKPMDFSLDIKISSFSDLTELILVHGNYSYIRLSKVILYTIYKETMVCVLLMLYQTQADYSGTNFIDFDLLVIYEMLISVIPIIMIGGFEKDVDENEAISSPNIYCMGYLNLLLSKPRIVFYYILGVMQGAIIYVFVNYGFGIIVNSSGYTEDFEVKGVLGFIMICLSLLQKIFISTSKFYLPTLISPLLTLGCMVITLVMIYPNYITSYSISQFMLMNQSAFWVIITTLPSFFTACYIFVTSLFYELYDSKVTTRLDMFRTQLEKLFIDTDDWKREIIADSLKINYMDLSFVSSFKELEYQQSLSKSYRKFLRGLLILVFIIILVYIIMLYIGFIPALKYQYFTILPLLISAALAIVSFVPKISWKKLVLYFYIYLTLALITKSTINTGSYTIISYPILETFFSVTINFRLKNSAVQLFILFAVSIIISITETETVDASHSYLIVLYFVTLNFGISTLCICIAYLIDLNRRRQFVFWQTTKIELEKTDKILSYLLPSFVKKRVKDGIRYIAEDKGTVSVIFIDMCDFDNIVADYTPQELTFFLDDVFGRFDKICESLGVTKIETVGKTYLACAGLKDSETEMTSNILSVPHARRCVEMGLSVIREANKVILKNGEGLKFKIGINSGPVTAGVVGYHKPQFSLVGDTVNTASRMASTLIKCNSIQISLETYKLLGNVVGLSFTDAFPEVKGKGRMNTMIVDIDHDDFEIPKEGRLYNINTLSQDNNTKYTSNGSLESSLYVPSMPNIILKEEKNILLPISNSINLGIFGRNKIFSLFCAETKAEKEFHETLSKHYFYCELCGLIISLICNIFLGLLQIMQYAYKVSYNSIYKMICTILEEVLTIVLLKLLNKSHKKSWFGYILVLFYSSEIIIFYVIDTQTNSDLNIENMLFYYRFLQLNFCSGQLFSKILLFNVVIVIVWVLKLSLMNAAIDNMIYSFFFIVCVIGTTYNNERKLRKDYLLKDLASKEVKKTQQLLIEMMPAHVLKNLEQEVTKTDKLRQVTVLYADIVGFTAWSSEKAPSEVVNMLSELFTRFDQMCLVHSVYKVHTIGDCYVAMGYKGDIRRNPANESFNILNFANSLINVIAEFNDKFNCGLGMRIGLHTGEVIGGITGTNIIRYDIYGKDVLIANKMESNGLQGEVVVSHITKSLLEDYLPGEFHFKFLKEIKVLSEKIGIFLVHSAEKSSLQNN